MDNGVGPLVNKLDAAVRLEVSRSFDTGGCLCILEMNMR